MVVVTLLSIMGVPYVLLWGPQPVRWNSFRGWACGGRIDRGGGLAPATTNGRC
jgi:hypothetical protein